MRSLTILVLTAAPVRAGSATANSFIVLYDNTNAPAADTFTSLSYSAGPYDGIGDSITLASPGTASDAFLQLFNNGTDAPSTPLCCSSTPARHGDADRRHLYPDRSHRRREFVCESGVQQPQSGPAGQHRIYSGTDQCDLGSGPSPGLCSASHAAATF